jgi:glycerophosphoryl diester phosphodiesterase
VQVRRAGERFIRIGHRGAAGQAPENTLTSFRRALEIGVDAVELDVQLSADDELVVIHDEVLDRTTSGLGPVCARSWAELAQMDAGAWYGAAFRGERIPRLAEVLELVGDAALVNVEIKAARDLGRIEPLLLDLVRGAGAERRVVFSSFHPAALRTVRRLASWAAIAVLWDHRPAMDALAVAAELGALTVNPGRRLVDAELVEAAHARDLGVWVWTVNEPSHMRRLLALGVDALFSDYPERFAAFGPTTASV